jgi:hypothetical protein
MFIGHAVLAFVLAVLAVALLTLGLRLSTAHRPIWAWVILLFLIIWAGGLWLAPAGTSVGNVYWLPFTLIAVLVAILLAAILPPEIHTPKQAVEREREIEVGLGIFFWTLIGALSIIVILGYRR